MLQGRVYIVVRLKDMRDTIAWWKGNGGIYMTSIGIYIQYILVRKGGGNQNVVRMESEQMMDTIL